MEGLHMGMGPGKKKRFLATPLLTDETQAMYQALGADLAHLGLQDLQGGHIRLGFTEEAYSCRFWSKTWDPNTWP